VATQTSLNPIPNSSNSQKLGAPDLQIANFLDLLQTMDSEMTKKLEEAWPRLAHQIENVNSQRQDVLQDLTFSLSLCLSVCLCVYLHTVISLPLVLDFDAAPCDFLVACPGRIVMLLPSRRQQTLR
jgi:hypothetical protein